MGLVASQARLLMLTSYKSDLEFKMQQVCQARMQLAATAQQFAGNEQAEAQIQNQDKQLEMMLKTYETQQKAAATEYESVQKIIQKNIEVSFKYMS